MWKKRMMAGFLAAAMACTLSACSDEEAEPQTDGGGNTRAHYITRAGGGADTNTIMIYCIGSDLESQGGYASMDFDEIMQADYGENVNVLVQTGGALAWDNAAVSPGTCQRFSIADGQMTELANIGLQNMTDPNTLSDFLKFGIEQAPADRYSVIFWNHGGGTMAGYGYDENFQGGMMTLQQIGKALSTVGVKFDFIGFDACLMATIETAYMLEPYADYMIASAETEPGNGWSYTNWLSALGEDSSMPTEDFAKILIDDFVDSGMGGDSTLSLIDLRQIPAAYESLNAFMDSSINALQNNQFSQLAEARANTKEFGEGDYEQIDLIDYLERVEVDGANELRAALNDAILYHNSNIEGENGLAMYYPYSQPEQYEQTAQNTESYGFGDSCTRYFRSFANALAYGDMNFGQASPAATLTETEPTNTEVDYTQYEWYDEQEAAQYQNDFYAEGFANGYEELVLDQKGDYFALRLSEQEWEYIDKIELEAYLDDGEGFIALGSDNVYEFDDDGDLKVDFDNTWVAIDGELVSFYAIEEWEDGEDWYSYGYVPAVLNGQKNIEIMLRWDAAHPEGYVMGYRATTQGVAPAAKGLFSFKEGDSIVPLCDYYKYDGSYEDSYEWGEAFAISMDSVISYEDVGEMPVEFCAKLTDIYQNQYYTETLTLS